MVTPRLTTPLTRTAAVVAGLVLIAGTAAMPTATAIPRQVHSPPQPAIARAESAGQRFAGEYAARRFNARVQNPTNPLAERFWGVDKDSQEQAWPPYLAASGHRKKLLARIALRPKAKWYGDWLTPREIGEHVRAYISSSRAGHPHALVQMTIFRVQPWEKAARYRLPTNSQIASYKRWIDNCARAIRSVHMAIVLQPDGPFANQAPHHSLVLSHLVRYAAERFSQQPHTTVYIEVGSADWAHYRIRPVLRLLINGGIRYVRGFALDGTHYDSTASEIRFGTRVVHGLALRGYHSRHFIVDTAENGRPFTGKWWHLHPTGTNFNNAGVCRTRSQTHCVTLGIPPTWHVAEAQWGLPDLIRAEAARHVDGYLWFGRPWLNTQTDPFEMGRALPMCRTTPFLRPQVS
jgi:endoglucanase